MTVTIALRASTTSTGGRDGHSKTSDGSLKVNLSTPKELDRDGKPGNNTEQLFAMR